MHAILLIALAQFFGPPTCKQGQSCTVSGLTLSSNSSAYACGLNGAGFGLSGSLYSLQAPQLDGGSHYVPIYCDGVSILTNALNSTTSGGASGYQSPLTKINSKTISSGVITTGNNLQGFGVMPVANNSNSMGLMAVKDYLTMSCSGAGVGAGNAIVSLVAITGTSGTVCTVLYPCATAANTPILRTCNGYTSGSVGGFGSDYYGTRIDVSGCTTAPTDCFVSHDVYANSN